MEDSGKRLALAAALVGVMATFAPASGAEPSCRQLEIALSSASGSGDTSAALRANDAAIHRQNIEIQAMRRLARDAECGFSLVSRNIRYCASLNAALQRMGSNLDTLHDKRNALARRQPKQSLSHILAQIEARGCRKDTGNEGNLEGNSKSPSAEALAGPTTRASAAPVLDRNGGHIVVRPKAYDPGTGDLKTTCVRICDGYFFPMSNAATFGDFQRDQANCESACPRTEMQVFYQRGMAGSSADMLSAATGRPYSELMNAYLYKRVDIERAPTCGCNVARDFSVIGGAASPGLASQLESSSSSPSILLMASPPSAKNHATQTNISQPALETTDRASGTRQIRVVGPRFFPDPKAAIDLQAPARTEGQ